MKIIAGFLMAVLIIISLLGVIGWVKSIIKLTKTDFQSPYKAELMYGVGVFTGAGAIIGWININD